MDLEKQTKEVVRSFLSKFIPIKDFKDDDAIFSRGFANSLFGMQLVVFIENEFSLKIGDEGLELENFYSINAITAFIKAKGGHERNSNSE